MAWIYIALFKAPKALYRNHYSFIHILTSGGKLVFVATAALGQTEGSVAAISCQTAPPTTFKH